MSARVSVDPTAATPPFEQIRSQIAGLVAAGELTPGDRLPTVRALAADLRVAVGTVNRAYRELEAEGVVETRRRTGTIVAGAVDPSSAARRDDLSQVRALATDLVREARRRGVPDSAVLDLVNGELSIQHSRR